MEGHEVVISVRKLVREKFEGEGSGHDWWHIDRVTQTAISLAKKEGANAEIVELAALLHDIADHKFHDGDLKVGPKMAEQILEGLSYPSIKINQISQIISEVSFKGAHEETPMTTIEGQVVQDADRLDAIGAIGIARCFAYGGSKNRLIYDPEWAPETHPDFEAYRSSKGPSLNHFYEKLLLLKDRLNTKAGREEGEKRHMVLVDFVRQLNSECSLPDWGLQPY